MKNNIIVFSVFVIGGLLWIFFLRDSDTPPAEAKTSTSVDVASAYSKRIASTADSLRTPVKTPNLPSADYSRWKGGRSTDLRDPRWKILNQRDQTDPGWRGKIEIEFYGKVVDEDNQPVAGASIKLSRGDLSPAGTTQVKVKSDADGLFLLTGVVGRGLNVSVEKMGYYASKLNRHSYEYAEFSDENFHQPDPHNPVLFHLRKKRDSESLIYRERELKVTVGEVKDVMLDTGGKLQIELLANPRPQEGSWSMRASVVNGGIQVVAEEFPFLAPTDNYQSSLVLDNTIPKPPRWTIVYQGGVFYLKTGSTYGRIEIQMISGKDWMRIKSWFNPSGSRNLEFDPAKVIKPMP